MSKQEVWAVRVPTLLTRAGSVWVGCCLLLAGRERCAWQGRFVQWRADWTRRWAARSVGLSVGPFAHQHHRRRTRRRPEAPRQLLRSDEPRRRRSRCAPPDGHATPRHPPPPRPSSNRISQQPRTHTMSTACRPPVYVCAFAGLKLHSPADGVN